MGATGTRSTVCSSDRTAARIDELQFELGEGPQWLAMSTGESTLQADLSSADHSEWPLLGSALMELAVAALFTVPMRMGAVIVGAASLYRDSVGDLTDDQRISALAIASAIAAPAIERAVHSAAENAPRESALSPALRREVHQATGMILVQLNTTATIAYARLQAYAFANGRTVLSVARDVIARTLIFTDDTQ